MCGRYQVSTPVEDIARRFDATLTEEAAQIPSRYNVAPSLAVPVVRVRREARELAALTWGLVPNWAKERPGVRPINARADTIFEKATFRTAILRRRCLIPADGFYEWQQRPEGKQPWRIGMLDGSLFAFGGIWEYWAKEGAERAVSCAIVVTGANEMMATIHDRMPVIIAREDYARWLDPKLQDPAEVRTMLTPYPEDEMKAYPISSLVNNAKNEGAELIVPLLGERDSDNVTGTT